MELRFEADQEFQVAAVEAVAALFDGQPRITADGWFQFGAELGAIGNRLDITDDDLLANLREVQRRHGIVEDGRLESIEGEIEAADGTAAVSFPNFTVEMET